jgi:hypothetical protein
MLLALGVGETHPDIGEEAKNDTALPLDPILFGEQPTHPPTRTTTTQIGSQTIVDSLPKSTSTTVRLPPLQLFPSMKVLFPMVTLELLSLLLAKISYSLSLTAMSAFFDI